MPSPLEVAKRLKNGETLRVDFATAREKNDFDYEVLKKLLDLYRNDMKEASRTLTRLKSTPAP